jgi:hypothetical protein
MNTYNIADVNLVFEWSKKYLELNTLVKKVFSSENPENPLPFPSFEDEIEYQRLRFWFWKNQNQFVPIWANFCISIGSSTEFVGSIDEMEYRENPFLYFYSPDNLLELAFAMGATSKANVWDPNTQVVEQILNMVNRFNYPVIYLVHWIGEFAETSG